MKQTSTTVKPTATGYTRREARYEKLLTTIERAQRKMEKADRTVTRCVKLLAKLERQRRRMQKAMAQARAAAADELVTTAAPVPAPVQEEAPPPIVAAPAPADELEIPTYLRRTADGNAKDAAARAEIEAAQAAEKKRKAERAAAKRSIKKQVLDAELTGQRRKMPLTGRAALAAIKADPANTKHSGDPGPELLAAALFPFGGGSKRRRRK